VNSDLCTLRIDPTAEHGWMVAENRERSEALVYVWERVAFPWLMVRHSNPWPRARFTLRCKVLQHSVKLVQSLTLSVTAMCHANCQTWEENRLLDEKPWCGEVLCRGLEFSSYAFATDRKTVRHS
jgi:hypothetical protein